jgi:hypothetical protein
VGALSIVAGYTDGHLGQDAWAGFLRARRGIGYKFKPWLQVVLDGADGTGQTMHLLMHRQRRKRQKPSKIAAFAQMNESWEAPGKIGTAKSDPATVSTSNRGPHQTRNDVAPQAPRRQLAETDRAPGRA